MKIMGRGRVDLHILYLGKKLASRSGPCNTAADPPVPIGYESGWAHNRSGRHARE
jgi:hypothetical protein